MTEQEKAPVMTLAVRRTRLACAVWLAVWAAAGAESHRLLTGAATLVLALCLFDTAHGCAVSLRRRRRGPQ